ncbi:MAG: hypothetical protein QF614_04970, partial [SAR324 cluster bacterium]|nr:hypothetical protein [SAR324 cluster bacterium]
VPVSKLSAMKKVFPLLLILLIALATLAEAQGRKKKKWRASFQRFITTVNYSYETANSSGAISASSSASIQSTAVGLEWIFTPFFTVETILGISPGRNYSTLEDSSSIKIGDVAQDAGPGFLLGGNWYWKEATEAKFNMNIGLLTGSFSLKNSYNDGGRKTDGSYINTTYNSSQSSNYSVNVQMLKFGTEYGGEEAGFKFEIAISSSAINNSTSLGTNATGTYQQYESITISGGPIISVFTRF